MSANKLSTTLPAKKLLSIVCAVKNGAVTIPVMLESYASQRTIETELIVIDACSTDATADVLKRFEHCIDGLIVEPDRSIYEAWNKGVSHAQGRYVSFIGADDRLAPGAISALLTVIRGDEQADYIHGYNVMLKNGRPSWLIGRPYSNDTIEKYMPMAHVMSAHRRAWVLDNGGFDDSYKSSGDYDFLLRMRKTMRVKECPALFAYVEDAGVSRNTTCPIYESYRARRSNGVSLSRSLFWLLRGLAGFYVRRLLKC